MELNWCRLDGRVVSLLPKYSEAPARVQDGLIMLKMILGKWESKYGGQQQLIGENGEGCVRRPEFYKNCSTTG